MDSGSPSPEVWGSCSTELPETREDVTVSAYERLLGQGSSAGVKAGLWVGILTRGGFACAVGQPGIDSMGITG